MDGCEFREAGLELCGDFDCVRYRVDVGEVSADAMVDAAADATACWVFGIVAGFVAGSEAFEEERGGYYVCHLGFVGLGWMVACGMLLSADLVGVWTSSAGRDQIMAMQLFRSGGRGMLISVRSAGLV